ncbi:MULTISPECIES: hypothetical protein [Bradyrhizobium]|uniref:hypothetical protein n=1 Tax=Bradyrhizobium TaxID=374 RepID=UPI000D73976A|nr:MULTISPECIES: hypothetical protein [Bradyrhizobium]AWO93658.1 hypothetical protein DI395_37715 [Bradyrhizobium diazoefficiens]MDA9540040.1 hypothetical protein [Bradyrhizobium sp. CCBAU 21362]WLA76017.1 hypothetical protein QIH77_12760 [Bradyrhizobium diazoefficiens]
MANKSPEGSSVLADDGKRNCFNTRHCERSEAIQTLSVEAVWIASSHQRKIATQFCRELLAMTALMQLCATIPAVVIASSNTPAGCNRHRDWP